MPTTTLNAGIDSNLGTRKRWRRPASGQSGAPAGSVTTYFYVTVAGAFGSTTDPSAVPAGAGIVRRVTS